ncbi:hypothetical protein LTS16_015718 [Friedmanniomyces endolithicus]|nr:hypothetical protein LTR03_005267 [Friedmanniomyces endolithicus]KAK0970950.1 hypothetical protein LTS01_015575 [Friedmanniomyces endolithicus]KAK1034135.1 hypothetical protein LTS16_015718 [Friedmanniomyces endolithicus]
MGDHGGERSFFDRVNSSSDYTSPIASDDPVTGSDNPYSAYAYPEQLHDGPYYLESTMTRPRATTYQTEPSAVVGYNAYTDATSLDAFESVHHEPNHSETSQDLLLPDQIEQLKLFNYEHQLTRQTQADDGSRTIADVPVFGDARHERESQSDVTVTGGMGAVSRRPDCPFTSSKSLAKSRSRMSPVTKAPKRDGNQRNFSEMAGGSDYSMPPRKKRDTSQTTLTQSSIVLNPLTSVGLLLDQNFTSPGQRNPQPTLTSAFVTPALATANGAVSANNFAISSISQGTHTAASGTLTVSSLSQGTHTATSGHLTVSSLSQGTHTATIGYLNVSSTSQSTQAAPSGAVGTNTPAAGPAPPASTPAANNGATILGHPGRLVNNQRIFNALIALID